MRDFAKDWLLLPLAVAHGREALARTSNNGIFVGRTRATHTATKQKANQRSKRVFVASVCKLIDHLLLFVSLFSLIISDS